MKVHSKVAAGQYVAKCAVYFCGIKTNVHTPLSGNTSVSLLALSLCMVWLSVFECEIKMSVHRDTYKAQLCHNVTMLDSL